MTDKVVSEKKLSAEILWAKVLDEVRTKVSPQVFTMWFEATIGDSLSQNTLWIKVPNPFFAEWIEEHHSSLLDEAITRINGEKLKRSYKYEEQVKEGIEDKSFVADSSNLQPRYTFSHFVVGETNKFAHAAALSVAKAPGKAYNPLFIYGSVGLGKTHLLEAIGNYVKENFENLKVFYVQCETILNELIYAIQTNKTIQFKNKYRRKDVLLIDDIEFLEGKEDLQEETFHMFNSLYDAGKQCVFTSDRPPSALKNLQERLVSRLRGGLICDLKMPSLETRAAILKRKAEKSGISVPENVIFFIAENVKTSIRDLEGALTQLFAISSLTEGEINIEIAQNILSINSKKKSLKIEDIQKIVAEYYNLSVSLLKGKRRMQSIVKPRNMAIYLARELTALTLTEIGDNFGGKDHATMLYSYNQVKKLLEKNNSIKQDVENLLKIINKVDNL